MEHESAQTIITLNRILSSLSIPLPITRISKIPSSLWIILFERIFNTSLSLPSTPSIESLSTLLNTLSSLLSIDLDHITAQSLLDSNPTSCAHLTEIYNEVFLLLHPRNELDDVSSIARFDESSAFEDVSVDFGATGKRVRDDNEESDVENKRARVDTPPRRNPLTILDSDTPHTKALKRRQLQLLKLKETKPAKTRRRSARIALRKSDVPLPILNFEKFQQNIKDVLPQIKVDQRTTDKTWKGQIDMWKHALNDRIWAQTKPGIEDKSKALHTKKTRQEQHLSSFKKDKDVKRNAKAAINERERAVVRMSERQKESTNYVENAISRKRLDNERTHQDFLTAQRNAIIRERADEKRRSKKIREEDEAKKNSRRRFLEDQIKMLKEELQENKRDQDIADKAAVQEERKNAREEKSKIKANVERIKEKLKVDLSNDAYLERDLARIKESTEFIVVDKRR